MENSVNDFRKQVAIFGNFLSWTGNYKSPCEELADKLEARRYQVVRASKKLSKVGRLSDMIATALKMRSSYALGAVEVYSGPAFFWAEMVCFVLSLLGKPYVLTLHGGNLPEFSQKYPGRVKRLLNSAAKVTIPSGYFLDMMKSFRNDMILIPNPINIDAYPFRLRKKITPELIWLRKFRNIYNAPLVPKTLDRLVKKNIDVHITMIGPDSGDGSLEETQKLAQNLNVLDRIKIPGGIPKEDVPTHLELYDLFINTTNIDNTPISVIEAMACGLCIVSTDVGGIPYLLEHEKDALLVPPNDSEAMTKAVMRILNEPGLAEYLSQNARNKAEQFSWNKVLPMWEKLLANITINTTTMN